MAQLLTIRGSNRGVVYSLGERTRIGRLGENEIQVADPNVSRIHAEIVQDSQAFSVFDRGSKNGVLVNGQEISERILMPGDEIVIGGAAFVFEPDFQIENARFTDNSVYLVSGEESGGEITPLDEAKVSTSPCITFARLFDGQQVPLADLASEVTAAIQKEFAADSVVIFMKDAPQLEFYPLGVSPAGLSILASQALLQKALERKTVVASRNRLENPPGFEIKPSRYPAAVALGKDETNGKSSSATMRAVTERALVSAMCAPMIYDGVAWGLILVQKQADKVFAQEDMALLNMITMLANGAFRALRRVEQFAARPVEPVLDAESRSLSTRSLRMQEIYNSAKRSAEGLGTILISGESGTGKETLARFIHESSSRANGPFVIVNCARISPDLFETELFGYEKDAFEGALKTTPGRIEEAQGGTLLLHELGELDLGLQPKLLRFLQDCAFFRIGGSRAIASNARVIGTTTVDLAAAVRSGKFREDLWYRLNVIPFQMPSLRERREDIGPLVDFFVNRHSVRLNKRVLGANDGAIAILQKYDWPGNIRELENAVERAVILAEGKILSVSDFSHIEDARRRLNSQNDLERKRDTKPLAEVEKQHILIALKKHNFNQARAAEALGLHRNTLRNKIVEYGIEIAK